MAYATPADFVESFGLKELAQLLADEEGLVTPELLADAIAGTWSGDPSDAEKAATIKALARAVSKFNNQSNVMDGYLRVRLTLPLVESDANAGTLLECCLALTRASLADDSENATDRIDEQAKTWRAWLRDIQSGKATLAGAGGAEVPTTGGVQAGQAVSQYDWRAHSHGSFWSRP